MRGACDCMFSPLKDKKRPDTVEPIFRKKARERFLCLGYHSKRLNLLVLMTIVNNANRKSKSHANLRGFIIHNGRGERSRTPSPRFWRPMLCQLSYSPALFISEIYSNTDNYILQGSNALFQETILFLASNIDK